MGHFPLLTAETRRALSPPSRWRGGSSQPDDGKPQTKGIRTVSEKYAEKIAALLAKAGTTSEA